MSQGATFVSGVTLAIDGARRVLQSSEVRRAYVWLALGIAALALVFDIAGVWVVVRITSRLGGEVWLAALVRLAARIGGIAVVLLAAPVLAFFAARFVFPLFAERAFFAGLATIAPKRAADLRAAPGLSLRATTADGIRRASRFVVLTMAAFLLSLLPVVGGLLAPLLQVWIGARAIGWSLLDPYFDKLELRFADQHAYVRSHHAVIVGFGLPYAFVLAIPLLGVMIFAVAQAATGLLVGEVLEPADDVAKEHRLAAGGHVPKPPGLPPPQSL